MKDLHLYYKTIRFAAIIRIVCDISMIVLEIVYEGFCKKVILGITKVMTFRVSFSTEMDQNIV